MHKQFFLPTLFSLLDVKSLNGVCVLLFFELPFFQSFDKLLGYIPSVLYVIAASRISSCLESLSATISSTSPILLTLQLATALYEMFFVCFNACIL